MGKVVVLVLSIIIGLATQQAMAKEKHIKYTEKDLLRKSIVYDKNTPDVFYCPVNKPTGMDKMIVMRLNPPGSDAPFNGQRLSRFMDMDDDMKRIKSKKH
uniref:Uncharacterized protein n=1 Tax=Anopheles coluzzii TaxID=1518534 RepID=A0A6E8VZ20_ANOCL